MDEASHLEHSTSTKTCKTHFASPLVPYNWDFMSHNLKRYKVNLRIMWIGGRFKDQTEKKNQKQKKKKQINHKLESQQDSCAVTPSKYDSGFVLKSSKRLKEKKTLQDIRIKGKSEFTSHTKRKQELQRLPWTNFWLTLPRWTRIKIENS